MLNFLRKYQKIVFGVVTAALILSLTLFGANNNLGSKSVKEEDYVIGTAVDGSSISKLGIDRMVRFLASDRFDVDMQQNRHMPNLFNNGVIRRDFLESGLGEMLASKYFEHIKKDLEVRLEKQKRFKTYVHPQAPFLSAENIYAQFVPSLQQHLKEVTSESFEATPETFQSLANLYVESSRFPTKYLRQFLGYQENQYQWLKKDPYLRDGDLSLFYFHSMEDWFGSNFIELVSQFVHNASIYAKEKGYKVSFQEARSDLLKLGYEALQAQAGEQEINGEMLNKYWKQQLISLRLDEKTAVGVWQKVLLFRKLFDDFGHSIFLDKLTYEQYQDYTSEATEVKLYAMPEEYKLPNFRAFLKFQTYLEAVSKDKVAAKSLLPDSEGTPVVIIEKNTPELLERVYEVEISHVTKKEVARSICLKDTWNWQLSEKNFNKLKAEFKDLHGFNPKTDEERTEALDRLADKERLEIDEFTRNEILKTRMDQIQLALNKKSLKSKVLHISLGKELSDLDGVFENGELIDLLNKAPVKQEMELDEEKLQVKETLSLYTQDEENYYKIQVVKKPLETKLLSYKEALGKGILDKLLDKRLKAHEKHAKAIEPVAFQNEDGSSKDFSSVKDQIGRLMYKDLIKQIQRDFVKSGKKLAHDSQKESLDFAAKHRLYHFVKVAKEDIEYLGEESLYLDKTNRFHLNETDECIKRKEKVNWTDDSTFSMKENAWSNINVSSAGSISFYQILKKSKGDNEKLLDEIKNGQTLISKDAKRFLMNDLLKVVHEADGIHLDKISVKKEKES
ncbi:hypothetical protein COB11_01840 [Candidatus Aerophobetes bacterium]|uniref:Uncharacterized protein n=1 Tax=Aerophobetes bacterium TaxID=2030807 RepID=A0A2A4YLE5_UNCAE|nr:MAG: hypothetical protein COB11_01840 [Candidatus Aerophobetes bacterium]